MTYETEFTIAGFVILKVVKKMKNKFFEKKKKKLFAWEKFCRRKLAV